jgi:hypothetical protein
MSKVVCEICKAVLSSKYILKTHLETNKACLVKRNITLKTNFMSKGVRKLEKYREQANRDRFVLPIENDISLFSSIQLNIYNKIFLSIIKNKLF